MKIIMKKTQKKNPFTRRPTDTQSSFWGLGGAGSAMELTAPQHEEKLFVIFVCCSVVFSHVIFYRRIFCSLSYLRSFLIFFSIFALCEQRMCVSHWTILFIRGIEIHGVFMCLLVVVVALLLRWWHAEQFLAFAEKCYTKLYSLFPYSGRSVKAALWIQQNRKNQT